MADIVDISVYGAPENTGDDIKVGRSVDKVLLQVTLDGESQGVAEITPGGARTTAEALLKYARQAEAAAKVIGEIGHDKV